MDGDVVRKSHPPFKVYCLPQERETIRSHAAATGLSVSVYLRRIGLGTKITSIFDHHRVADLAKVNGDLGRLGGLLKLWLARDPRTAQAASMNVHDLLVKIDDVQNELRAVMTQVIKR